MLQQFIPPIIYSCLKKIFRKNNLSEGFLNINAKTLRYKTFGELNSDKYFYVIQGHSFAGFFSILQFVLCQLKVADELGMIPIVDYKNFPNTYGKDELGGNVWEYYFEPVSSYSLDEVYKSKHVFFSPSTFDWSMGRYLRKEDELYKYFKKYIQIKEEFKKEIDNFYEANFKGHKVLGVHWRGYEQNITAGHPYCPTKKQIFENTDFLLKKYNCDRIYFLTEDSNNYNCFYKYYNNVQGGGGGNFDSVLSYCTMQWIQVKSSAA